MRHGSAGRFPTRTHVILNRFDLKDDDLLGKGSESSVYAMDAEHVLRVYNDNIGWEYPEARRRFYATIDRSQLPFAMPEIYTIGAWVGHVYTVEQRMPGQDFGNVLPKLAGEDRRRALTNYVDAAAAMGNVRFPDKPYGELITNDTPRQESWQAYLILRMEQALARGRTDLETDVPELDRVLASVFARLPVVGDKPVKSLVHGDYFPANVFIDDDLEISGVGDFSYATMVGDAAMDLTGAVWMLGAMASYCPDDSTFMRDYVAKRWGSEILASVDFYKLYYSVFFCHCKYDDPITYWWCVRNLREL